MSLDMRQFRSVSKLEASARKAAEAAAGCRLRHSRGRGPDWLNKSRKTAVFVHGCFWHGCPLHFKLPRSRPEYWAAKIGRNRQRDEATRLALEAEGWRVLVLWEHDILAGESDEASEPTGLRRRAGRKAARIVRSGRIITTA